MTSASHRHRRSDGVEVLRWPSDAPLRRQLARLGRPRLVLHESAFVPPVEATDPAEVWVPVDAAASVVDDAAVGLLDVLADLDSADVVLDADGVVRRGSKVVGLSAPEMVVAAALVAQPGRVLSRVELLGLLRYAGEISATERSLDAVIYRLRQQLAALHVVIRNVRLRGYAIELRPGVARPA
jgi:hypothetical protein